MSLELAAGTAASLSAPAPTAGQVALPPVDDELARAAVRLVGLLVGAFVGSAVAALGYRWYTREAIPRSLAILVGTAVVAVYLNTVGLFATVVSPSTVSLTGQSTDAPANVFAVTTVLFNVAAIGGGALASTVGRVVGDRVATDVFAVAGARELDAEVSRLVRTVGRVTTVTLPEDVGDIEGYDPVTGAVKEQLSGKTLLFPRRLTVAELRDRLAARLREDHGVGHVDVELDDDGTVTYLAVGSRAAGLGPTLAPGTVALAVRGDPGPGAAAGDPVQVWSLPDSAGDHSAESDAVGDGGESVSADGVESPSEAPDGSVSIPDAEGGGRADDAGAPAATPTRVATGELRGVADDVATVAIDESDADRFASDETYRLVTLPADVRVDREFASLLRGADETMAVVTVEDGASLAGRAVADVDATVVAIRPATGPVDAIPARSRELAAGDVLYVVASPDVIRSVERRAAADPQTDGGAGADDVADE